MYPSRLLTSLLAVWLIMGGGNGWCAAGETTLTYQGRLDSAGRPANGLYQMRFSVWTAATGGTSPTGVLGPCEVPVASGLFQEAVPVPDVPGLWTGEPRWLEVAVKPAAAPDSAFVALAPRQLITRVPMAGYADAAARLTSPLTAAQLPGAAARLDLSQTFTGTPSFQPPSGAPFAVSSTSRVDRLNADLLDGRDATSFWERKVVDGVAGIAEPGDTPIELRLGNGNYGVLRLDRGVLSPSLTYSLVPNSVATGLSSVVYLGGGERARPNRVEADFATILNGRANLIQSNAQFSGILASDNSSIGAKARNSVIAGGTGLRIEADSLFSGLFGGFGNVIRTNAGSAGMLAGNGNELGTGSHFAGLLGGEQNTIEGGAQRAVILGGRNNRIESRAEESAILGGYGNRVSSNATDAVVVGGDRNYATKQFTLAAGRQARANHLGTFVWSDSEAGAGPFASQKDNEFAVKATGGARFETKGAGLWVDGQRFLPPGGPGDLPDGSILAAKLADGAVLMELTDDDGAGSGLDADRLDGLSSEDFWRLTGNAGTSPLNHFLGTTDNQPLELRVDNLRALRLQPDDPFLCSNNPLAGGLANSPSLIGGFSGNSITVGKAGSVIAGGGAAEHGCLNGAGVAMPNTITADFASILGGLGNSVGGAVSAIGGGARNTIGAANYSFIANGRDNIIEAGDASVILGGVSNRVELDADFAVLGGGKANLLGRYADYSVIAGGHGNTNLADSTVIGGGKQNAIGGFAFASTIAGGWQNTLNEFVKVGTIGGGSGNSITGPQTLDPGWLSDATIAGGAVNSIQASTIESPSAAAIGGGVGNIITGNSVVATISGGTANAIAWSGWGSTIGGGERNMTTNGWTTISGGAGNVVEAPHGSIGGGERNGITPEGRFATIRGGTEAKASNFGQLAYASGNFRGAGGGPVGEAQTSIFVLRRETTNNLPNELFLDGEDARMTLGAKSTWTFDILVTARSEAGLSAGYQLRGVIQRDAADNTSLIGAPITTVLAEQNAAWNVTVEADDTAEALVVKVTGSPSEPENIRWVATVRTVEVVF